MRRYHYFQETWEIADYRYISYFKVTAKSLSWTNKINDKSVYIPKPSKEIKFLLKDTLIKVERQNVKV